MFQVWFPGKSVSSAQPVYEEYKQEIPGIPSRYEYSRFSAEIFFILCLQSEIILDFSRTTVDKDCDLDFTNSKYVNR